MSEREKEREIEVCDVLKLNVTWAACGYAGGGLEARLGGDWNWR